MIRLALIAVIAFALVSEARAGGFTVGIADPGPAISSADVSALGLTAERRNVLWLGQSEFTGSLTWTPGLRHIVSVWGGYPVQHVPDDADSRGRYCSFVLSLLSRYPEVSDVDIWNEPNLAGFWGAGADAYADLVAACAPRLHAEGVRVLAPGMSPASVGGAVDFARRIAARGPHLIDEWDQHEYGTGTLSLKIAGIRQAFGWKIPVLVGEGGNAWGYTSGLLMGWAYCSGASGFLNFKLRDDGNWHDTGLKRADGTAKPDYAGFAWMSRRLRAGNYNCARPPAPPPPSRGCGGKPVDPRLIGPPCKFERTAFRSRHPHKHWICPERPDGTQVWRRDLCVLDVIR